MPLTIAIVVDIADLRCRSVEGVLALRDISADLLRIVAARSHDGEPE